MRRALVLGGGAIVGAFWESGVLHGLAESGFDVHDFDAIVGTSAGTLLAVTLANGKLPSTPDQSRAMRRASGRSPEPRFPFDLSEVDANAVTRVFGMWRAVKHSTPEQCAAIGALARENHEGRHAARWLAEFETNLSGFTWVERDLRVIAVDAVTGSRRVFRGRDGIALPAVAAASCAIPGICPPVQIEGGFYMDGGVHSTTNADVLVDDRPAQVLIVAPSNSITMGFGALAERMLEQEVAALRAVGSDVRVATPTERDTQRFGKELMDYSRIDDAYAAGLDAGREWANTL